jgi:tetratricopeptide (TPR) repeat protein
VYYKLNKFDEATAWYEKTIRLDPRRKEVYANLGDLYFQLGRVEEARPIYEKYLELAPNHSYAPTVRTRLSSAQP